MEFSLWSFLLGATLGWGVEWVIDRWYWRGLGTRPPGENAYKADLSALRTRFDDAQVKLDAYETEVSDLRAQLKEGLSADSFELHEKLRAANAEIKALKMAVVETPPDNSADSSLKQELAEAKAMIERLQSENTTSPLIALNELQAKLDEAESELSGYRSVEEITRIEIQELRQKLSDAESKAGTGSKGKAAVNEEILALKAQLDAKDQEIAVLRASGGSGGDEDLRSRANQADYFAKQLENARATIATLEQEMLRPQPAAISGAADEGLRRENAELQTEMLRLKTAYETQNEDIQLLKNQLQERERNIQGMASLDELADARARAEAAEERVTTLMADRQHGIEELESLRKQVQAAHSEHDSLTALRQEIEDLSAKLASRDQIVSENRSEVNALTARLHASQSELEDLRSARSARENELSSLREEVASMRSELREHETLSSRLKEAEIELEAYNDLKSAKEHLQDRVGQLEGELAEARAAAKEAELEAKTREAERAAAEVAQLRAHLEHHRTALANALSQLDNFGSVSIPPVATSTGPTTEPVEERDPLERIKGVGFVYERKLWDAGILTFEDLANATPEEVTEAIAPEEWQQIDPASWIAEAKKLIGG